MDNLSIQGSYLVTPWSRFIVLARFGVFSRMDKTYAPCIAPLTVLLITFAPFCFIDLICELQNQFVHFWSVSGYRDIEEFLRVSAFPLLILFKSTRTGFLPYHIETGLGLWTHSLFTIDSITVLTG